MFTPSICRSILNDCLTDSKVLVNYSNADASPLAGQNFYRLKMIDRAADGLDGMFAYSQIRNASFKCEGGIAPYPNPAVDKILIRVTRY